MVGTLNREDASNALIESFKTRFGNGKFAFSPSIEVSSAYGEGNLGLVAKQSIKKDEFIVLLPMAARLSGKNVMISKTLQEVEKEVLEKISTTQYKDSGPEAALAVTIMHVLSKNRQLSDSSIDVFLEQAATWPSEDSMKESSIFYMDDSKIKSILNKSGLAVSLEFFPDFLKGIFELAVIPALKKYAHSFIDFSLPSNKDFSLPIDKEFDITCFAHRRAMWNTFVYAFSLVWSRAHGEKDRGPSIVPLVELCNGTSSIVDENKGEKKSDLNVMIGSGNGTVLPGGKFVPETDNPCSVLFATRDIDEGEELMLSYGPIFASQFLIKYGTIPEALIAHHDTKQDISLWCNPSFIPDDPKRLKCLKNFGFPSQDYRNGKGHLIADLLTKYDLEKFQNGDEVDAIKKMRLFLILSTLADDSEISSFLTESQVPQGYDSKVLPLICKVIDYNLKLLTRDKSESSEDDVEKAKRADTPGWEKALLLGRVAYRETLLMWRHEFGKRGNMSHVDGIEVDLQNDIEKGALTCLSYGGCARCGRTYPTLVCSRCKKAKYCSRQHQRLDWKKHKLNCKK